ncbi:MAG: sigma-70 family RNA polymerase sigma factor [Acidobacteriota bacterium]
MDIEKLYQRYGPMVFRRCRQLLGNEDQALDATQDVFARLIQDGERLTMQFPSSLLYRMATNHCLNRIRDSRREQRDSVRLDDAPESLLVRIAIADEVESRSTLDTLFRRHGESTRTMAVFHYLDGMTLEETAREVGMSVSGVRKRLRALRRTLKELGEPR